MRALSNIVGAVIALVAVTTATAALVSYMLSVSHSASSLTRIAFQKLVEEVIVAQETRVNANETHICFKSHVLKKLAANLGDRIVEFNDPCIPRSVVSKAKELYLVTTHGGIYPLTNETLHALTALNGSLPLTAINIANYTRVSLHPLQVAWSNDTLLYDGSNGIVIDVSRLFNEIRRSDDKSVIVFDFGLVKCIGAKSGMTSIKLRIVESGVVTCYYDIRYRGLVEVEGTLLSSRMYYDLVADMVSRGRGSFTVVLGESGVIPFLGWSLSTPAIIPSYALKPVKRSSVILLTTPLNLVYRSDTVSLVLDPYRYTLAYTPAPVATLIYQPLRVFASSLNGSFEVNFKRLIYLRDKSLYLQATVTTPYYFMFVYPLEASCSISYVDEPVVFKRISKDLVYLENLVCIVTDEYDSSITVVPTGSRLVVPTLVVQCYYPAKLVCKGEVRFVYSFNWWLFRGDNSLATMLKLETSIQETRNLPRQYYIEYLRVPGLAVVENLVERSSSDICTPYTVIVIRENSKVRVEVHGKTLECKQLLPGILPLIFYGIDEANLDQHLVVKIGAPRVIPGVRVEETQ